MAKKKKVVKKAIKKASKKVVKKSKKAISKKKTAKVVKKALGKKKTTSKKAIAKTKKIKPSVKQKMPSPSSKMKKIDYSQVVSPLGDRIIVKIELPQDKVTAGGLIIPATSDFQEGYSQAKVLAVGPGWKSKKGQLHPMDVQVGNLVLFSEYKATKVQFNNEDLFILNESDVLGVVVER